MLKTWKKKWIKALRSGEYTQGQKRLVTVEQDGSHSFCCLGVLCDILPKDLVDWKSNVTTRFNGLKCIGTGGDSEYLSSDSEYNWIPVRARQKMHIEMSMQRILARLNDKGKSFSEIAEWIEDNL